jgi:hypothetical protein
MFNKFILFQSILFTSPIDKGMAKMNFMLMCMP